MGIIDTIEDALRFKDTIFLKEASDLQSKYDALAKLTKEYPDNLDLKNEYYMVKKGLEGENEIAYQLKKAHIGMYVLRDVKIHYEDLTAQIDYVLITPLYTYYVECKNLLGIITINDKGDFIREYVFNGKKVKKGMYSPLRQVEAQREVLRKLWEKSTSGMIKIFASNKFDHYRRVLVVAANKDTILNTRYAPKDVKDKVIRADALVKKIQDDFDKRDKNEFIESQKNMEKIAKSYIELSVKDDTDYYEYYKNKYCCKSTNDEELKNKMIAFRKKRSSEMSIPAYYVFTNEELDELIKLKPKSVEELRKSGILPDIKTNTHGKEIIRELNL